MPKHKRNKYTHSHKKYEYREKKERPVILLCSAAKKNRNNNGEDENSVIKKWVKLVPKVSAEFMWKMSKRYSTRIILTVGR